MGTIQNILNYLVQTAIHLYLIAMLLRFLLEVFGVGFSLQAMPLDNILMVLGLVGILTASLVAVFQYDIKRMLAYSTISHIGFILLGLLSATEVGLAQVSRAGEGAAMAIRSATRVDSRVRCLTEVSSGRRSSSPSCARSARS